MPLTPEQKKNLLIGGGVGGLALLGVLLLGRRTADASPRSLAGPPPAQAHGHHAPAQGQARSDHRAPQRHKRRRHDDGGERDDGGDNARGEYGRKRKHRRHHHGD